MWRTFVASQTTGRLSILDHGVLQLRDRLPYISIYERPGEREDFQSRSPADQSLLIRSCFPYLGTGLLSRPLESARPRNGQEGMSRRSPTTSRGAYCARPVGRQGGTAATTQR